VAPEPAKPSAILAAWRAPSKEQLESLLIRRGRQAGALCSHENALGFLSGVLPDR
jgi:hypothetical protein